MNSALLEKFESSRQRRVPARFKNVGAGWREIGGKRIYFRSRWESNYGRFLQWRLKRGEILEWEHEPEKFKFNLPCGKRSYLPDFRVKQKNGDYVFCEVKGFNDWRSQRKLAWMKKFFPTVKLFLADGKWFKANSRRLAAQIPGWEKA